MLVEDDKSLREIYSIRLVAEGYNIVSAGDGEEALALAAQEKPDLIISDVMMPKISGFDMLDILRSQPETKDIKVIMMTALSSEDQRQRGEMLGADRYLVKSQVGIEDVVNTVHEILGDQPNASAHTSMSTAAVMPTVEQAEKEAAATAEAPVNIDTPTTAETTIAPQNSSTPAPDVNQQMQTAAPEAPQAPSAPQSMIPEPPAPQGPPGGTPANFNQAPAANPAAATMQQAAGANPMMPVNQARKATGGERIIAPLDDPAAFERRRQSNERLMDELLNEGQPAPHAAGVAYSAPQAPAASVPNPQLANNPAMTATSQQYAAQAIANQGNNAQPVTVPPKANMTLSAALQGSAQPSAPKPGSTATMPGQPTPPPAMPNMPPMPQNMPMPPQQQPIPQAAPQQPAPQAPQQPQPAPQQAAATPTNSPQQASPQVAQPAPQKPAAKPAAKKNPVNNMSPEMIAQVVQATKVKTVHDDDEVVEAIKPAYISELEEDLSADLDNLGGAKNTMAARMLDELKDDEITIAASQIERPVISEQAVTEEEQEVELPDALKDALNHSDVNEQNPNINFSNGEDGEDEDFDNGAVEIIQAGVPDIADDGMGPNEPEMTIKAK